MARRISRESLAMNVAHNLGIVRATGRLDTLIIPAFLSRRENTNDYQGVA